MTVSPENLTGSSTIFSCGAAVALPSDQPGLPLTPVFAQTYELQAESSGTVTLSGVTPVAGGNALSVECFNGAGQMLNVLDARWYVAPITTS